MQERKTYLVGYLLILYKILFHNLITSNALLRYAEILKWEYNLHCKIENFSFYVRLSIKFRKRLMKVLAFFPGFVYSTMNPNIYFMTNLTISFGKK